MSVKFDLKLGQTRERLHRWGFWYHRFLVHELAYSPISLLEKIALSKGLLIRSTGEFMIDDPEAEEMDELVNKLTLQDSMKARLIKLHYASFDELTEKIELTSFSKSTYFRFLREAEEWISACFYSTRSK